MNADGGRRVVLDADVAAKVGWCLGVGIGLLVVGLLLVAGGFVLIVVAARRSLRRPAAGSATPSPGRGQPTTPDEAGASQSRCSTRGTPRCVTRLGGVRSFQLALWPTVPAEEAVVRRRATSATRQRTIEANGIDRGASCSRNDRVQPGWAAGTREWLSDDKGFGFVTPDGLGGDFHHGAVRLCFGSRG
jgi:hypothetical protein